MSRGHRLTDEELARRISARRTELIQGDSTMPLAAMDDLVTLLADRERRVVARELRDVAGDPNYTIGSLDPKAVILIASQIESSRG